MQLHQLLRYIHNNVAIMIFDLSGIQIASVRTKQNISLDLYEYEVLEINQGYSNVAGCNHAIYITIVK